MPCTQFPGHVVVHMPSCSLSCFMSRVSCLVIRARELSLGVGSLGGAREPSHPSPYWTKGGVEVDAMSVIEPKFKGNLSPTSRMHSSGRFVNIAAAEVYKGWLHMSHRPAPVHVPFSVDTVVGRRFFFCLFFMLQISSCVCTMSSLQANLQAVVTICNCPLPSKLPGRSRRLCTP